MICPGRGSTLDQETNPWGAVIAGLGLAERPHIALSEPSLAERDRDVDPDGRFRVNGFFCHADSWQAVLPRLVDGGDIVLMDLRSFSPSNAGCTYELAFLVSHVPFRRCLLISDPTTDERLVDEVLANSLHSCLPTSPNAGRPLSELTRYRGTTGRIETTALLQQLCENACRSRAHTGSR